MHLGLDKVVWDALFFLSAARNEVQLQRINSSTNWATTTAKNLPILNCSVLSLTLILNKQLTWAVMNWGNIMLKNTHGDENTLTPAQSKLKNTFDVRTNSLRLSKRSLKFCHFCIFLMWVFSLSCKVAFFIFILSIKGFELKSLDQVSNAFPLWHQHHHHKGPTVKFYSISNGSFNYNCNEIVFSTSCAWIVRYRNFWSKSLFTFNPHKVILKQSSLNRPPRSDKGT